MVLYALEQTTFSYLSYLIIYEGNFKKKKKQNIFFFRIFSINVTPYYFELVYSKNHFNLEKIFFFEAIQIVANQADFNLDLLSNMENLHKNVWFA